MIKRKVAGPKIEFKVSSVELRGKSVVNVTEVCVELDLPDGVNARSPTHIVKDGKATFRPPYAQSYSLDSEQKLREAIMEALRTASEDDSEVLLHVVDPSSRKGRTLGTASFRLEQALATGHDHSGPLPIKDSRGEEVGTLTCAITCISALHQLQEDIKTGAAKAWAEGSPETGQLKVSVSNIRLGGSKNSRPSTIQLRTTLLSIAETERLSEPIQAGSGEGCDTSRRDRCGIARTHLVSAARDARLAVSCAALLLMQSWLILTQEV